MENRKSYVGMKMTILFLFLFGVFAPNNSTFAEVLTTKDLVTIMHTNDMHGRMEFMEDQYSPSIGLGRVKTFKDSKKPTVLVDAGDAMQGLPISNYSKGMDMVKAMNAVGYDAMTLGNHEFDFGLDTALAYQKELKFPIVSANVFYKDGTRPFKPYTIVEKDVEGTKKKFALIGLTTPETTTKTHPNNVEKIKFTKPAPAAIETINEIGDKADYFVFMTHLGIDETTVADETSTHLATELAKKFPNKKIFIADGHSHTALPEGIKADNILIGQTGNHLNNVGMMTGDYTGETPKLTAVLHPFSELKNLIPDPTVEGIVATAKANFDKEMSGVVLEDNKITFNGERANARTRETNLGNIIGDSLLSYGKTGFSEVSDFAIMNGGGIRQNIKAGKVTKGDIVGVMPFGNTVSQIKVTGNEVYGMFEHSLRSAPAKDENEKVILDENGLPKLGANGGFLQVSDSIKVTYDSNLQGAVPEENTAGKRVTSIQIKDKSGKFVDVPRNDTTTYNMVTNDFLAAGGDGYSMLAGKAVEQGPSMDEVFMEYLTGLSSTELAAYEVELPFTRIISKKSEVVVVTDEQDKLTATIAKAEALNETDYTADSWAKLETALENAKIELAKKDEEKAKVANESLTKAIAELEKVVVVVTDEQDKLVATIEKAEALKKADYTAESWAKLETALANAKTELAKKDEEKAKVANESLTKAIAELEKVVVSETEEQEKLAATIEKAGALKKADYTAESWAKLETALANAKTELSKKDEEKAKAANKELTAAIDGLKKVSNTSKTPKQDALAKTIASLVKADYTAHSWAAFEPTLTSAKTELAAKDETRADAANTKLINAKKQLVEVKSLKDLVASSKKLKEADYTKATWTYFAKSLSDAESLLKKAESVKDEVTEKQISGAKSALEVSIKKLEKTGTNNSTNKKKYYSALPQTGEADTHYGALGLVVLGTTGVYIYRRKQDKDVA